MRAEERVRWKGKRERERCDKSVRKSGRERKERDAMRTE